MGNKIKLCQVLANCNKITVAVSLIIAAFHLSAGISFLLKDKTTNFLPLEGSLSGQLAFIHLLLLTLLVIYFLSMAFETLVSNAITLLSSIFIILVYFGWYYEKFAYLEPKGTLEYERQIGEIGFFQGATALDYWALSVTTLLVIYAVFRFFCSVNNIKHFIKEK